VKRVPGAKQNVAQAGGSRKSWTNAEGREEKEEKGARGKENEKRVGVDVKLIVMTINFTKDG
jgi:hypothetical protein